MRRTQSAIFRNPKMEMTMRMKLIAVLVVSLTAQAAAASERHHRHAKGRAEQLLNSNACGASVEWPEPYVDTYQGPVYEAEYMAPTANGG
jgi:hypothetical protein